MPLPLAQFAEFRQQFPIIRLDAALVHLDPADDALLVHDENRAVGSSKFFIEHTVFGPDLTVGPKIGHERVRDTAKRLAPRLFGLNWIATDSQNLAIRSLELGALRFVGRNLLVSGRGERE